MLAALGTLAWRNPELRRSWLSGPGVALALLLLLIIAAAATPAKASDCIGGGTDRLVIELLFGRNIGARVGVTNKAFRRFVDVEVTPRFPDGFTLLDTIGQFRASGSRAIVREPGKQLVIALADEASGLPRVREIIEAYKRRFQQQSVAMIAHRSCVAF